MNQFVQPGSGWLRGRWFWLASAAALLVALRRGLFPLPTSTARDRGPADAATAQDLVNLLLVGPMLLILGWWGTAGTYAPISYGWSAWASP
jgi:hypothetical protein